ncbi:GAF domain-containing protein [Rubellimicrobium roseum]|uniref:GAF domain-containing protein n=1 Tax=Rubellimicrobium roseum TaxID=687525 RepID=A0A5C4NNR4_9RHOB|nr:GAF domain-containing protein [Rubellimicrobium roseum]TNC74247.1 GAF domain-containing protein [Rubellimicrobium roseum]
MIMTSDTFLEAERLRALRRTGLLTSPAPAEFQAVCERARARFGTAMALITLVAEDRVVVAARAGTDLREAPRLGQFCDRTIRGDRAFVVPDALLDPDFAGHSLVKAAPFLRFYAGAPLTYVRQARLGALCLLDGHPRDLGPEERAELERMADEAMGALAEREFDRLSSEALH